MGPNRNKFSWGFHLYKDIGIDLGTANTLVFLKNKGIILQEPSVVAVHTETGELLAVGNDAREMIGRTPSDIIAIRPLQHGVIADFNITRIMLKYFISKALKGSGVVKPRVLVGVPMGITQVEKRAVLEAASQAGAKDAYLIEEPIAAAIGAGLAVEEPLGNMIVDIGGGTSEVAILSLGGVVVGKSLRTGGDEINQAIVRYMRKTYNLEIGERSAELAKMEIGYAMDAPEGAAYPLKGRYLATGLPHAIDVTAREISEALSESIRGILEAVKTTLEKTPPELASDIINYGMVLTGGGALLKNIAQYIGQETRMPVRIAEDPLSCVAKGAGKVLQDIRLLKRLTIS
mgnify:CR=1 FL=1